MQNQRARDRLKTYIGARIEQPHGLGTMNCIVRNMSPDGACLEFHNTATVVDRFVLVVPSRDRRCTARVAWRAFGAAGVAFETSQPDSDAGSGLPTLSADDRLRTSEAARRALQARLDSMNEMA